MKEVITDENISRYGKKVVSLQTTNSTASDTSLYQDVMTLPAGNYVFSAYVKVAEDFTAEAPTLPYSS